MTNPASADTASRKPVMLTVDDDPGVSRAVARDLRRKYGDANRIVRAESGHDALDTLKQLKLRGETVAMLVADYRMPQMTGIDFLEAAMDLYPAAKRVLLTAYADTHAAIDAINVVDLDHYLLKPWDPPEEKLYPRHRRAAGGLEASSGAPDPAHQGDRSPLVGAILGGPRLPGPQRAALQLVRVRRARRRATAASGRRRRQAAPGRRHRTR